MNSNSSLPLLSRSPHPRPRSPHSSVSFAQHRLRAQPTPSLPNLRAGPLSASTSSSSRAHPADHTADRMSDETPASAPSSPIAASYSAAELQKHLYNSFLEGKTADVSLRIHGSWRAIYRLHRVILIQAGFFKSLFTAGFVESMTKFNASPKETEVIDIVFDDPNISRAAFEICIARLYGGGPPIHISPTLIPTPSQPLTPTVPFSSTADSMQPSSCPPGHHPSTPRFLLSLLATAVFLSIPSVAAQTLSAVLTTVGPRTVIRFLGFATGKGVGEPDEEEPEAAVGLEGIAVMVTGSHANESRLITGTHEGDRSSVVSAHTHSADNLSVEHIEIKKEDPADSFSESSFFDSSSASHSASVTFFYGGVSNKIGEAAVCWITRWGGDMLRYEEELQSPTLSRLRQDLFTTSSSTRKRATTIPFHSGAPIHRNAHTSSVGPIHEVSSLMQPMPLIWRRGGLDARWVRRLLSSDVLFVKGEKERYNMARSIVELRRKDGILPQEEEEWKSFFETGIYYANLNLDDLLAISQDISSTTGKLFVPISVLQSAHWDQSLLHHHILSRPAGSLSSVPQSPSSRPKELGFTVTTADIGETQDGPSAEDQSEASQMYFPVPEDSSSRLGDSVGPESASMDQLFDLSSTRKSVGSGTVIHTSEANCFGMDQQAFTATSCRSEDPKGRGKWTPYPPLRFSVEFWDIDALKEKSRLHSHTVWYAGSLWNVYVQIVRKKGVQLGVYLHRQSSVDPIPPSSASLPLTGSIISLPQSPQRGPSSARPSSSPSGSSTPHSTPASPTQATARPSSLPSSYSTVHVNNGAGNTIPATAPPVTPPQPYRDPRSAVSAYFTIACASATGANLTKFTSAPDVFSVSQSWGWKSSSLRTEEYLEMPENGVMKASVTSGKEVSLRATIVLGVV